MAALVLIVVDSPDARALYGEYLEFCGFRVMTAADGGPGRGHRAGRASRGDPHGPGDAADRRLGSDPAAARRPGDDARFRSWR